MLRVGLYARVSTSDQHTLAMQMHALREYGRGSGVAFGPLGSPLARFVRVPSRSNLP